MNYPELIFICPVCKGGLIAGENNGCRCSACNEVYPVVDGIWDALPRNSPHRKYLGFYEGVGVSMDKTGVARLNAQKFKVPNVLLVLPDDLQIHSCLDIGCGGGWFLEEFIKHKPIDKTFGIDISLVRLCEAHTRLKDTTLIRGDVESIPLTDNSIDLAIVLDVIEHIEHPEVLLKEISRISSRLVIPKKCLKYEKPLEVFNELCYKDGKLGVALTG